MKVKKLTADLIEYIEKIKKEKTGNTRELKSKIENYKSDLISQIEPRYRQSINLGLNREDYTTSELSLNSLIGEIKNAEFDVINKLLQSVSLEDFKFDKISSLVFAKSNYILTGETYEADILVAAFDSKQKPQIIVGAGVDTVTMTVNGEQTKVEGVNGICKLKLPAGGPGLKQYGGVIKVMGADGTYRMYPFSSEYVVATPSAAISPIKTNVFYIGVDNPISISVAGVPNESVTAAISGGGTITKAGSGLYNVSVTKPGDVTINVSAKTGESSRSMGSMKYRVKRIPDPKPYINNVSDGTITKATLIAAGGVIAKPDGFDIDYLPVITDFTLSYLQNGELVSLISKNAKFTSQMLSVMNKFTKGQKVYIENIKCKMPDGNRSLSTIALTIN